MKKVKFSTPWNKQYRTFAPKYKPSITVPDDAMTIQEILARVSRGLTTGLDGTQSYGDDDDADDLETGWDDPTLDPEFDKLDALEMLNGADADKTRQEYQEAVKRSRKKLKDREIEIELDKRLSDKDKREELLRVLKEKSREGDE